MNDTPMVSVVIPAYNASQRIGETLQSVLAQDFTDFEVIVVDDGSTDDTATVVANFGERVRCIQKLNEGTASARNVGIRAARGEYIAFVDADDLWAKEKLRLQMNFLIRTGLAWVYSDAVAFDDESRKSLFRFGKLFRQYAGDVLEALFLNGFIPSPTPIVRRSVFEHVGYFSNERPYPEDWAMWLNIAARYPIGLIPRPLAYYRVSGASKMGRMDHLTRLQVEKTVIENAVAQEPARLSPLKNRALANSYFRVGRIIARDGNLQEARQLFHYAVQLSPGLIEAYVDWAGCLVGGFPLRVAINLRKRVRLLAVPNKASVEERVNRKEC